MFLDSYDVKGTKFQSLSTAVETKDYDDTVTGNARRSQLAGLPPWSYELDYVAVVRIMCNLLFPDDKFGIWVDADTGRLVAFYSLNRRYAFRTLWVAVADILLNPGVEGGGGGCALERVKRRIWDGDEKAVCYSAVELRNFEEALRQ